MPNEQFKKLGAAVLAARKKRRFTQEKLADVSGISVRYISKIENGTVNPSYEVLSKLGEALGTSFDSYLKNDERKDEDDPQLQSIIKSYKASSPKGKLLIAATTQAIANELLDEDLIKPG